MSTEQHIDTGVIDAALDAWFGERGIRAGIKGDVERDAMEAALNAADEKRRELAQADPEGQEYAYRTVWRRRSNGEITRSRELVSQESGSKVAAGLTDGHFEAWVERALLGTWERVG